ncbi:perlucin-like protein [Ruditapes philippinarum]|uniref:perlucin-like protein n=1 Tax=Ruditapes philippinarum TaxID=129788 RepID=UPI00295ACEF4|nr:perlucin-like protein [Ruditapes philippinarum]
MIFIFSGLSLFLLHTSDSVVINIEESSDDSTSFLESSEERESDVLVRLAVLESKIDKILKWAGCPNGWVTFNDNCYLFGAGKLSFNAAKLFCTERGSYMVVVETKEENDFLKSFMKTIEGVQNETSYWSGLTEHSSGKWIWQQRGTEATFFDWGPSEPHLHPKDEDCVWFEQINGYRWSDIHCYRKTTPLCEKRMRIKS